MNEATLEAPAPVDVVDTPPERTLTAHDRCDLCSAQAYVRASFESGDLLFCNHHYKSAQAKIDATAVKVLNESWALSEKRLDVSA